MRTVIIGPGASKSQQWFLENAGVEMKDCLCRFEYLIER